MEEELEKLEKEFIPYEQALELKELGFDSQVFGYYGQMGANPSYLTILGYEKNTYTRKTLKAPLYQQTFVWFLEKYNLYGVPEFVEKDFWSALVVNTKTENIKLDKRCKTKKDAELKCLIKLIKLCKGKN